MRIFDFNCTYLGIHLSLSSGRRSFTGKEFQSQIQDSLTYVDAGALRPIPDADYQHLNEQHGRPLQALDMGETAIDEDTFNEYLGEMRQVYTADKVSVKITSSQSTC